MYVYMYFGALGPYSIVLGGYTYFSVFISCSQRCLGDHMVTVASYKWPHARALLPVLSCWPICMCALKNKC